MEKIKNIEMLRFLFSLSIVAVHLKPMLRMFENTIPLYQTLLHDFQNAHLPVDYFFIIAGFFMFLKTDFNQEYVIFAKKKILRFMPLIIFTLICAYIASLCTFYEFLKYENVFTILLLQCCGFTSRHGNVPPSWFVSTLFWSMSFYFYLKNCVSKKMFNLITCCIIFFCYSFLVHAHIGHDARNAMYIFNHGMLRGFAGLGVGYFVALVYKSNIEKINNFKLNIIQKLLITGFEIYLFCFVIYYTCLHYMKYKNSYLILIIAFIGLFFTFISKKGYFTKLLNNNFSVFLGQFSYSIFITHYLIKDLWKICICNKFPNWVLVHPYLNLIYLFILVIIIGVLTYYLVEKPAAKYLKKVL